MKALFVSGIFALCLVACGDKGSEAESATPQAPKAKKAKLTALSDSKPGRPRPRASVPSNTAAIEPSANPTRQVVLPPQIQNDPEALARREEIRQKAAIAREESEARRAAERAERIAVFTEQMTARLQEMDANGDGFLAKEEVSGRLASRFDDSDTNADGYLDATEQAAIFEAISERMNAARREGGGEARRGFGGGDRRGPGRQGRGRN